ncbi:MAG: hypothetical protein IAE88_00035 [Rhodobacteraceae bacterium]|uniref:YncE family protein n=1 Tax=Accumulibacter sp. TaxID=2053492 RepID=UPI001A0F55C8|nr:hypothetical protein [Accumulibacter sp.]MBE2257212.1 hypothetical protein [Paracoccaceae bacterium]MCB1944062.1 hypothetical protein [Accumulibacter sp.]
MKVRELAHLAGVTADINMKRSLSMAATAVVIALSAQSAWAGLTVYIPLGAANKLIAVDAASNRITATYDTGASPEHILLARDGKRLYVANARSGTISAVSLATGKVERDYLVGKRLHGLDISDDGRQLFVSLIAENQLVGLDPDTDLRRVLALATAPYRLGAVRGTGKLYVSSRKEATIWVVDQTSLELLDTITLPGGEGHQLAIVP